MISEAIVVMANAMAVSAASQDALNRSLASSAQMVAGSVVAFSIMAGTALFVWSLAKLISAMKE